MRKSPKMSAEEFYETLRNIRVLGMTLRDYFAAHAPADALNTDGYTIGDCAKMLGIEEYQWERDRDALLSFLSYRYADAMLKERAK